jgi:hypothetical protein
MFKDNSRFSLLVNENDKTKIYKKTDDNLIYNKNDDNLISKKKENNLFKNFETRKYDIEKEKQLRKEEIERNEELKEITQERLKNNALSIESFPELNKTAIKDELIIEKTLDYFKLINNMNMKNPIKDEILVKNTIQPGWTTITRKFKTDKTNIVTNLPKKIQITISKEDLAYKLFNSLNLIHEKKTNQYIENWGFDEWQHRFQFSNYDYYYFDNLDEQSEYQYEDEYEELY